MVVITRLSFEVWVSELIGYGTVWAVSGVSLVPSCTLCFRGTDGLRRQRTLRS